MEEARCEISNKYLSTLFKHNYKLDFLINNCISVLEINTYKFIINTLLDMIRYRINLIGLWKIENYNNNRTSTYKNKCLKVKEISSSNELLSCKRVSRDPRSSRPLLYTLQYNETIKPILSFGRFPSFEKRSTV